MNTKQMIHTLMCVGVAKCASLIKLSLVAGSFFTFFSASSMIMPLVGVCGGTVGAVATFIISLTVRLLLGYTFTFKLLAFYIPGLCASLYWAHRNAWLAVIVPLGCMAAFIAHPVGYDAMYYSFFWLIPISSFYFFSHNRFFNALTATFIAHAVGSVIWLYADPHNASYWLTLIPVVIVERFVYALGMYYVYAAYMSIVGYECSQKQPVCTPL